LSAHLLRQIDSPPMSSKIFTTVMGVLLVGPFVTLGYHDAVSIKQHLQAQTQQIHQLHTESAKLDDKLAKTKEAKVASQKEVDQLEQQTQDAIKERQKLEAELGAN
jgi:regulator of replication initiation timing